MFCFNAWKKSCSIYRSTSHIEVNISSLKNSYLFNSGCSLNVTLKCVSWLGFLLQSFTRSSCRYVASIFFKYGEVIVEYLVCNTVFGYPLFCFYYLFMELSLFQSRMKNVVKDINQNFTRNKLNEKKSKHQFVKNLIYEHLTP